MSLPRGIRYETLPERLLQGKAFPAHTEGFLEHVACVGLHVRGPCVATGRPDGEARWCG